MTQKPCARLLCAALLPAAMVSSICARATVPVLEWDPETSISGYNVYIGENSGNYSRVVDVGLQTRLALTNLTPGITHFFAVTAYDADHLESALSEEVFYTPPVDGVTSVVLPSTFTSSNGGVVLRFASGTGQRCWIVASSNLVRWERVYSVTLLGNIFAEYAESEAQRKPMRFYRVIATLP